MDLQISINAISCIVPARNEAGHLEALINEVISVPDVLDIIIVEGGSTDETWDQAVKLAAKDPDRIRAFKHTGKGKFDAVQLGASVARFHFLLIWDADGTVPLECTKKVIRHALTTGLPTIGDRLRGEIEPDAMRFANWIGNWVFAILWSPILGIKPTDMLCGTKIVPTAIVKEIPKWLLKLDPYGDFALMATTRYNSYPITPIVVDYKARTYGSTNIHRWSGGFRLLYTTFRVYLWFLFGKKRK